MVCRNCKKELPVGVTDNCPYCGVRQGTYITPRSSLPQPKKKTNRAQLMSMLSVAFVVMVVCVLIPFLRNINRKADAAEILARYEVLASSTDKNSTQWENDVTFWVASVEKYKSSYPSDAEGIALHEQMMAELLDKDMKTVLIEDIEAKISSLKRIDDRTSGEYTTALRLLRTSIDRFASKYPEDKASKAYYETIFAELSEGSAKITPGSSDQETIDRLEAIDRLLRTTKESIIDFETLNTTKREQNEIRVTFRWVNKSTIGIENITITLFARDSDGEIIIGEDGEPLSATVRTKTYNAAGDSKSAVFANVWKDFRVETCLIEEVLVLYSNGESQYLPPEVCHVLWP